MTTSTGRLLPLAVRLPHAVRLVIVLEDALGLAGCSLIYIADADIVLNHIYP